MTEQIITIEAMEAAVSLFGSFDENIRMIEREYGVSIVSRGSDLKIMGEAEAVACAVRAINSLLVLINKGEALTDQNVRYVLSLVNEGNEDKLSSMTNDSICITAKGRPVKPKTLGQKKYTQAIDEHTITFGVGPAGTGKTYLAVAMAVTAFRAKQVNRIILTRPAVEAGEKLGFLPGDLQSKVDPYLRPLYDALFDMLGAENFQNYQERGAIEVAPLAYMRGRTLDDSFIILDEATSNLDNESELIVQQSLDKLIEGRTAIVIAHRLSTIRNATRIVVLTEDGIKESGTHDELIERNGLYKRLYELSIRTQTLME